MPKKKPGLDEITFSKRFVRFYDDPGFIQFAQLSKPHIEARISIDQLLRCWEFTSRLTTAAVFDPALRNALIKAKIANCPTWEYPIVSWRGESVTLSELPARFFGVLWNAGGDFVGRAKLVNVGWPLGSGGTVLDENKRIHQVIFRLRSLLGPMGLRIEQAPGELAYRFPPVWLDEPKI